MPKLKETERQTKHDKPAVKLFQGEKALTATQARDLLGWSEVDKSVKDFLLKDLKDVKIECRNNVTNRPLYMSNVLALMQEILRGRWNLNLENRIIGKTGLVLNGQHTFIALVLAGQAWELAPEDYPFWSEEPTIETSIGFGCDESDVVVNTMDTCKPRTLADVIYRSEYFSKMKDSERKKVSRMTDHAVKFLWNRTGLPNAFEIRKTHSESLDFIARHPRVLECVNHIFEENGEGSPLSGLLSPGYSAGLLYLMGSDTTDVTEYATDDSPNEKHLEWKHWDMACGFFVMLAGGAEKLKPLRTKISKAIDDVGLSLAERTALFVKAWTAYVAGEPINTKALSLKYSKDDDGFRHLDECPIVGGIDQGDASDSELIEAIEIERDRKAQEAKEARKNVAEEAAAPNPEEIKDRAKAEKTRAIAEKSKPKKKKKRNSDSLVGKLMWVADAEPWRGKVIEVTGNKANLKVLQGFQGAGNIRVATVDKLSKIQLT